MTKTTVCPCCPAAKAYEGGGEYALCPEHFGLFPYPVRVALCERDDETDLMAKWAVVEGASEPLIFHVAFPDVDDWIELQNIANDTVRFVRVSSILRCGIKTQ